MDIMTYDTSTNTVGSKEWLAATKDKVIITFNPFLLSTTESVNSGITIRDFFGSHIADAINTIKKIKR
jgi:hypothetical protein